MADEPDAPDYVEAIHPSEVLNQRANGWPDFHPETFCHRCGRRNINWATDDAEAWRHATQDLPRKELEILCPSCFGYLHARATRRGIAWILNPMEAT